jgi:UDP-2,4-diacetamido-2,4,6-trideoxy-beta-L-altropyranose hydrolase
VAGTLVIRADATPALGTGHVMRCLALGQAWRAAGGRVLWIGHCPLEAIRRRIRAAEFEFEPLDRCYPDPADLRITQASLVRSARESDSLETLWLAVDGCHFDPAYFEAVHPAEGRLLVVDDLGVWPEYRVDLLMNQNLAANHILYVGEEHTTYLLGPRYALIRPEFAVKENWQRPKSDSPGQPMKILVTLGGTDPKNATAKALQALEKLDLPNWQARVITGVSASQSRARPITVSGQSRVQLLNDVPNMAEQMQWADVALSAAGSTCWEMAFMQLPAAVTVVADNQRAVAEPLAAAGVVANLGPVEDLSVERIAAELS